MVSDNGTVILQANMLSGTSGAGDKKIGITVGQAEKGNIPVEAARDIGDKPVISLTMTVDGKQTEWSNPNAPAVMTRRLVRLFSRPHISAIMRWGIIR